ncbi:5-oxoprolinase subunit PxpB [Oceanithermus sp.]
MKLGGFYLILGEGISPEVGRRVWAASRAIEAARPPWLLDWIPSYNRVFIEFDAAKTNCRRVARWAESLPTAGAGGEEDRLVEVPVRYGGYDLPDVAARTGLSEEEVIELHSQTEYRVYAVGFTPGFPFMAELPPQLRLPRRATPRVRIPHLSVGIAGLQTGIYPQETPGGWNLLGRALVRVYDPYRKQPFLLAPGDRVRMVPGSGEVPEPPEKVDLLASEGKPVLRIVEPGLLTLLVDRGRFGEGRYGMARSGPMDSYSYWLANALLGNPAGAPALELNLLPPVIEALDEVTVSLAGYGPTSSGQPEARSFRLKKGEVLKLLPARYGTRSYLAVAGGFSARKFLHSASPDLKGGIGRPLAEGDLLFSTRDQGRLLAREWQLPPLGSGGKVKLRLLPGPQASEGSWHSLLEGRFVVEKADRMGVRLSGSKVPGGEVTSEAIPVGTVQVPASGEPMLLLADRGTIGGYAKPAVIHPDDLWKAGQLREGAVVEFVAAGEDRLICTIEV